MGAFEEALRTLYTYQSIPSFIRNQQKRKKIDSADLFNRGTYKPFLDAWVFVRVAFVIEALAGKVKICLVPQKERFPDAKLLVGKKEFYFEITEAMEPERKRGDEYKKKKEELAQGIVKKPELVGHLFEEGDRLGAQWIAERIESKVKKNYSVKPHLIVHANFLCYELVPEFLVSAALPFKDSFKSIWIVHSDAVLQLFDCSEFGKTDLCWHSVET